MPFLSAQAIYARLNRGLAKEERKSWRTLFEEALTPGRDHVHVISAARRAEPGWHQDERHVVYSLRRVVMHLGREGFTPDEYEQAYAELIRADRALRRGEVLGEVLLTRGQIEGVAGELGWEGACRLAGIEPPARTPPIHGFSPLPMLAHFYETRRRLPRDYRELTRYANTLEIPLPTHENLETRLPELCALFTAERTARGLTTPPDGPTPGDELSPAELDRLLADAPRKRPRGYWTLERTLTALREYVDLYEGKGDRLCQRHYRNVYREHRWPAQNQVGKCAKRHGYAGFNDLLAEARQQERKAA